MINVAVVTATRAEYGILNPLIKKIHEDKELNLKLIVTGTHLSPKYGHTVDEIIKDGYPISKTIPILCDSDDSYGASVTMANALMKFAEHFRDEKPDMLVILGDRTEMLAIASAAMNERIPIAHIHGGELTEGAVDDSVRHALTKMSYLHFASTAEYRNRIIQMGEDPKRVYNSGALSVENILNSESISKKELLDQLEIPIDSKYAMVTFHPVTLENNTAADQLKSLISAIESFNNMYYIISGANSDAGGEEINKTLREYAQKNSNIRFVISLGMKRYLNAVRYAEFVLGNSSSGIIEAPTLGTPTVNIGDRQKGRIMPETVINCGNSSEEIINAMKKASETRHKTSEIYGSGNTSEIILSAIKNTCRHEIKIKKKFFDIKIKGV